MSLVSEALKKAQREAALRDARARGVPEPLLAAAQPYRAKRGSPALLPVALALGAAALLAAGAWLFISSKDKDEKLSVKGEAARTRAPEAASAAAIPEPPGAAPSPAPGGAELRAGSLSSARRPPSLVRNSPAPESAAADAAGATPTPPTPSSEASVKSSADDPIAAAPAPAPPAPQAQAAEGGQHFVRTATLEDGSELRLGGIAWSATAPLAYLNGQLLGVGESAAGFRVARIERERVRLEGRDGRVVVLALR